MCKFGRQIGIEHPGIVGVDAERVPAGTVEVRSRGRVRKTNKNKNKALPDTRGTDVYCCWHEHFSVALFRRERGPVAIYSLYDTVVKDSRDIKGFKNKSTNTR